MADIINFGDSNILAHILARPTGLCGWYVSKIVLKRIGKGLFM